MKYTAFLFPLLLCIAFRSPAQNIVGYRILVGADAPAFLAFPSEVENARWDNNEMNDFFKFSTRNENTMQISYNGKPDPPVSGTGFSVIQGKNTHIFTLVFKKDYDINKDPVLYYDFSDKHKLKAAAAQGRGGGSAVASAGEHTAEAPGNAEEDKAAQRREEERRRKEMALAQQQKQKELEKQQKEEAEKAKQLEKAREAEIARAREEARRREAEQQKAQEQEAAIARANAEAQRKKEEEEIRLKKQKEEEDRLLAQEAARRKEKEKQEADKAKAERDRLAREEAERRRTAARAEQERLAKEKAEKEEAERLRKTELARQEAAARQKAKEEAEARLLALQREKEEAKKNARYTLAGLWNRYGKKGINLYEIPPEQSSYNNTDFYVAQDTVRNFLQSNIFLAEPSRLDIAAAPQKGIRVSLKSISFSGPIAYYRISVENGGTDDYLVGANSLAWYLPDGSPKVFLKCSYLTHISFFPLVKPGETRDYIYATRAANINEEDRLVFTLKERRPEQPAFEIFFDGSIYRKELARVEKPMNAGMQKERGNEEKGGDKKDKEKRRRKNREKQ